MDQSMRVIDYIKNGRVRADGGRAGIGIPDVGTVPVPVPYAVHADRQAIGRRAAQTLSAPYSDGRAKRPSARRANQRPGYRHADDSGGLS